MKLWEPYYVGGKWPYWQCRTPYGPWNFQAKDRDEALKMIAKEIEQEQGRE